MGHMKTPQYRSNLQQLLEEEKVRANIAFVTLLTVLMHCFILITFCHCGPHLLICIFCSHSSSFMCSHFSIQQKHRDLSGQAEQLHSVCQAHKDKIKGLFQAKLDEVRFAALLHPYIIKSILCVSLLHNKRSQKNLHLLLSCGYVINFISLNYGLVFEYFCSICCLFK